MIAYDGATAQMIALVRAGWIIGAPPIVGSVTVPDLYDPDTEPTAPPGVAKYWGRISFQTAASPKTSFATQLAGADKRRYTTTGTMFVQIFGPMSDPQGNKNARLLAGLVQGLLRSRPGCPDVLLSNARPKEIGSDGKWYNYSALADFSFDDLA